jgi:hypothetical protein
VRSIDAGEASGNENRLRLDLSHELLEVFSSDCSCRFYVRYTARWLKVLSASRRSGDGHHTFSKRCRRYCRTTTVTLPRTVSQSSLAVGPCSSRTYTGSTTCLGCVFSKNILPTAGSPDLSTGGAVSYEHSEILSILGECVLLSWCKMCSGPGEFPYPHYSPGVAPRHTLNHLLYPDRHGTLHRTTELDLIAVLTLTWRAWESVVSVELILSMIDYLHIS